MNITHRAPVDHGSFLLMLHAVIMWTKGHAALMQCQRVTPGQYGGASSRPFFSISTSSFMIYECSAVKLFADDTAVNLIVKNMSNINTKTIY